MSKEVQKYITYLSPEFIYVPFDKMELLRIKRSKLVVNNFYLGQREDGSNIFSPVSGKVIGTKRMIFNSGESNTLVIENDFIDRREKLNPNININKLKKSDIVASLEKYNLSKKINSKTTLVVTSLYDKKYDLNDMVINYESYEEILEAIDEFMNKFNMKNCYICIDRNDLYSINAYEKYINAFLNICIVHNTKKFKDENCVFYSIPEILAIHKCIHQDYLYDNTIVTIYDNKPIVVKVKIYSSLYELFKALKINFKDREIKIDGKVITELKNFVIDSSVRSIILK